MLGAWFGLVTGLSEAMLRIGGRVIMTQHTPADPQTMWMAPIAGMLVFLTAALFLAAIARGWSRAGSLQTAVALFCFLLLFDLSIFTRPRIHLLPLVLLSLGLGIQCARFWQHRPVALARMVRRTLPAALVAVLLFAAGFITQQSLAERRALAALPAPQNGKTNVLLLILDTVRAASLSLYGYARPTTPNLERIAAHGVVFESAFATAPWTLPSHATMFTGRYPYELSTSWTTGLNDQYPTLAWVLSQNGYRTSGFVANLLYGPPVFGLNRGFARYETYPRTVQYTLSQSNLVRFSTARVNRWTRNYYSAGRKEAAEINRAFLRWLGTDSVRPFFAFLNYYDAHDPYTPPAPYDLKFSGSEPPTRRTERGKHSAAEIAGLQAAYDGAIAYLDAEIGRLYSELERRGLLANTLIVITADHGEEFAEHAVLGHGNSLYLSSLQVPLIMIRPGQLPTNRRIPEAVTLRDLPASILDLLGISPGVLPGTSLRHTWDADWAKNTHDSPVFAQVPFARNLPDWYPVSGGDLKTLIVDPYQYIRNGGGREELYDIRKDPWQKRDLARSSEAQPLLTRLRLQVDSLTGSMSR